MYPGPGAPVAGPQSSPELANSRKYGYSVPFAYVLPVRSNTMSNLKRYFERYALVSLEKQARLISFLGEHILDLDLDGGTARFSDSLVFPFQVLGTESDNSLTWLWAWAEEQTEVPPNLLLSARQLRAWGENEGLQELTLPAVDLDRADGTMLSLIASEICKASGFYRDPYEGGTLFLLLSGIALDDHLAFDRRGLVLQLADLASRYDFNHRNALLSYFRARAIPATETGDTVSAELVNGERLVAVFDAAAQVRTINGEALA